MVLGSSSAWRGSRSQAGLRRPDASPRAPPQRRAPLLSGPRNRSRGCHRSPDLVEQESPLSRVGGTVEKAVLFPGDRRSRGVTFRGLASRGAGERQPRFSSTRCRAEQVGGSPTSPTVWRGVASARVHREERCSTRARSGSGGVQRSAEPARSLGTRHNGRAANDRRSSAGGTRASVPGGVAGRRGGLVLVS